MAKNIAAEVKKNTKEWVAPPRPPGIEQTFPRGKGQVADQAGSFWRDDLRRRASGLLRRRRSAAPTMINGAS
jgi:hypothetical protein